MFSYVTLLHALKPFLSEISQQIPISICLFSTIKFPFRQSEGVKISNIFLPLDPIHGGICGWYYICSFPNFSNSNFDCFRYALWILTYCIFKFYFQNKLPITKAKKTCYKKFLMGVYTRPEMKSTGSEISSYHD